ncbi:LuxR C-terminal-related transcriptional regulator [Ohtaekwangia koreensis]|uniref:Two component transcriptional regulator, LuxR family n=1 Tax=Ohtaekwangia koreensis TaxID=688867 RepID=A0A1T5KAZ7_9BACT|nr:response regulator transcription factor [Ohtaekwangia koreensis]SKC60851.1 two component transcriptional regulator, LuxR family [Ohtaekwangia koreensis]
MMTSPIRILVADNQPLTLAGLTHFLSSREDTNILGEVSEREQLAPLLLKHQPDLLIADYNLMGYVSKDDLRVVKDISPSTHILVISGDNNKGSILDVLQLGIKGYLTKECSLEEIAMAIHSTSRGEKFYCHKILDIIMEKHFSPEQENSDATILTTRETEILTLIAQGKSTQTIADDLHLSPHTVQTHRKSIIRKLNIKSPTEFVIYAIDFGLIKPK